MVAFYNINDITLGTPSHSGHEAYLDAIYNPRKQKIVYKKNKYGIPSFSRLEISFSQLAKLFLSPDLTPEQYLVLNEKYHVVGVAAQHLCYSIQNKESLDQPFYALNEPLHGFSANPRKVTDAAQIPIYFLDKLPQGYFATLIEAEKKGQLSIDYASLASILTTSYTMEEDDLHKGNFGFYMVKKKGKPQAVFFKIDHDLMFVDSIMGFHTRRPFHLFHGPSAFDIIAADLLAFPNLKYSANSYWPTRFGYVANPFDSKEYHSFAENVAFAALADNPEFVKAKWKTFYKHLLIPTELIERTLRDGANTENAVDRAHIALLTQAMVARLAALRAVLFSLKEFREFVVGLDAREHEALLREIIPQNHPLEPQIKASLTHFNQLCASTNGFAAGDTPLHTAIKLGEYRYEESTRMFGHFINTPNSAGQTPLDLAVEQAKRTTLTVAEPDIRKDKHVLMQHLLEKGAHKTARFKQAKMDEEISNHQFINPYLPRIKPTLSYENFKNVLRDIGEDHRFCMKYKKNLAIGCINHWIGLRQPHPYFKYELKKLQQDINGKSPEMECAAVKYIRQLRSKLWIIRQLRGLYGQTSTQSEINHLIEKAMEPFAVKEGNTFAFFNAVRGRRLDFDEQDYQPIP